MIIASIGLKDLYDPVTEKVSDLSMFLGMVGSNKTGTADVVLGHFIAFIHFIRTDLDDEGELDVSLGTAFNSLADRCSSYLLNRLPIVYENAVRIQIAKSLEKETEEPAPGFDGQELLDQAQRQAQSDLASIDERSVSYTHLTLPTNREV